MNKHNTLLGIASLLFLVGVSHALFAWNGSDALMFAGLLWVSAGLDHHFNPDPSGAK